MLNYDVDGSINQWLINSDPGAVLSPRIAFVDPDLTLW
jgi:hypothetical protein